jgi:hypothetical protein
VGATARMVHPASGYMVGYTLRRIPAMVQVRAVVGLEAHEFREMHMLCVMLCVVQHNHVADGQRTDQSCSGWAACINFLSSRPLPPQALSSGLHKYQHSNSKDGSGGKGRQSGDNRAGEGMELIDVAKAVWAANWTADRQRLNTIYSMGADVLAALDASALCKSC